MLNHLFFVVVGDENQFNELIENARKSLGIEINTYPALGLGIRCQEMLFGVETPNPVAALGVSKILKDISHREITVPFCSNVFDSGKVVSRIAIPKIFSAKEDSAFELFAAWQLVEDANNKRLPSEKMEFAVFEKENKFYLQTIAGRVPNLDVWQVKFNQFCKDNLFSAPCVTTCWLQTV